MPENNNTDLERTLFATADRLRKNIDAAEYKRIVLGLIFLKYISDTFEELHSKLQKDKINEPGIDPEERDEYMAENVFYVPPKARWSYLHSQARQPTIGKDVDDAMEEIEKENPILKGYYLKFIQDQTLIKCHLVV